MNYLPHTGGHHHNPLWGNRVFTGDLPNKQVTFHRADHPTPSGIIPDSNFSLQQICSRLVLQICKLTANLSRQECKCETSLQQVNASFEVTTGRTCSKFAADLHCKLIANYSKNRVRTQTGIELATYRLVA
ncbi:hypothetical protein AVEN_216302-1 [Araneus ventricosus]|uniref:Uncharacterized protein n=1 Tax=Araneus ventricosus TaxID=182803 RepID=A0A4Y2VRN4_ARAVE|nr:hypothetical protein AVEN_747-1 [Araneus ventricosus]GBO28043.1 hypothetical protein AVEN_216302-1 [Araneus ventricosus]